MLHKCAVSLTNFMLGNQSIAEEDHEVYVYGFEMILSTAASILVIVFISFLVGETLGSLVFLACFLTLRAYAGGYHANSYLSCFCTMQCLYGIVLALCLFIPHGWKWACSLILIPLCVILVFFKAPQDHPNRTVEGDEYKVFRFRSRLIILLEALIAVLLYMWNPLLLPYVWWLTLGMTAATIGLFVPLPKPATDSQ